MESVNRGVFGSITELKKKPAHLAVFIQYILSSRHDPAPLVRCDCASYQRLSDCCYLFWSDVGQCDMQYHVNVCVQHLEAIVFVLAFGVCSLQIYKLCTGKLYYR